MHIGHALSSCWCHRVTAVHGAETVGKVQDPARGRPGYCALAVRCALATVPDEEEYCALVFARGPIVPQQHDVGVDARHHQGEPAAFWHLHTVRARRLGLWGSWKCCTDRRWGRGS
jgi:hypothetical protein